MYWQGRPLPVLRPHLPQRNMHATLHLQKSGHFYRLKGLRPCRTCTGLVSSQELHCLRCLTGRLDDQCPFWSLT